MATKWEVRFSNRARKAYDQLRVKGARRPSVSTLVNLLVLEMEKGGPIRSNWSHFGKLGVGIYHCHLKNGHPTYVACWKVSGKQIEVYYVGTHEGAPY